MSRQDRYVGQFRPEFSRLHEDHDLWWIVPLSIPLCLAVVGLRHAGVSTVLGRLSSHHGFHVHSLSAELRRTAEQRGLVAGSRRELCALGDQLRSEARDETAVARMLVQRIRRERVSSAPLAGTAPIAIGGLQHPAELSVLRRLPNFHLVVVDGDGDARPSPRFRRVSGNGLLQAEYESDRAARAAGSMLAPELAPWETLADEARCGYLHSLDDALDRKSTDQFPERFRGDPGAVVKRAGQLMVEPDRRLHSLDNATLRFDELYERVEQLLCGLRPPGQVVPNGTTNEAGAGASAAVDQVSATSRKR